MSKSKIEILAKLAREVLDGLYDSIPNPTKNQSDDFLNINHAIDRIVEEYTAEIRIYNRFSDLKDETIEHATKIIMNKPCIYRVMGYKSDGSMELLQTTADFGEAIRIRDMLIKMDEQTRTETNEPFDYVRYVVEV